jgi:4-amino-4-deoxy-L-arabinose transferase-like glycosyltransferase
MRWSWLVLVILMLFDVWYRAHTFSPQLRDGLGIDLWPAVVGASEPLDCDEAAYAYIGHRILAGDVLYRDLTENKTPLGYWIYTLTVALGGYNELAIRIMPIPFILATIALVWWIAGRIAGPVSASVAAGLFILLSTDPYLFGNGANLEHFINLFSVASLALLICGWDRGSRWPLVGSGLCLGAAALVKQFALFPALIIGPALVLRGWMAGDPWQRRSVRTVLDLFAFLLGMAVVGGLAAAIVIAGGAGQPAFEDIFQHGRALATDTLPDPKAPPALIHWITGNADPGGQLPWPFGATDYLVWWATGSWPLWLTSIPAVAYLLLGPKSTAPRRLVAGWSIAAWAQVALPGLYWQHYYLLPIAGVAIAVAVCFADAISVLARAKRPNKVAPSSKNSPGLGTRSSKMFLAAAAALILAAAMGATLFLQTRDYLLVAPENLTVRYKGGGQWVVLRKMGRELARRGQIWDEPRLYIWGWQSPLHFYGRMDSPTRHFFVDNLLRDQADRNHWLIGPRTEEIMSALRRRPPELIFTGYPPFRALKTFLIEHYLPSRLAPGLWVREDDYQSFERVTTDGDKPRRNRRPDPSERKRQVR